MKPQGCTCPVCHKLFALDAASRYRVPAHDVRGQPCSGAGAVARLVSSGFYGCAEALRNGQVRK
jgi:hypothetical protein